MTTKDRLKNEIFWLLSTKTIDSKIYKAVMSKKNYTTKLFLKDSKLKDFKKIETNHSKRRFNK
jgi:hypothetical protein